MTLKGNYFVFYLIEFVSGILTAVLFYYLGDIGLIGLSLFFLGLILTMKKDIDEREMQLSYKINSFEGTAIGAVMAVAYFKFPEANLFYVFIVSALLVRGIIGMIAFRESLVVE